MLLSDDEVIHGHHLPPTLQTAEASGTAPRGTLQATLERVERELILDALKSARGNMAAGGPRPRHHRADHGPAGGALPYRARAIQEVGSRGRAGPWARGRVLPDRRAAGLTRADPHALLERHHEDLAVAYLAGAGPATIPSMVGATYASFTAISSLTFLRRFTSSSAPRQDSW